MKNKFCVLLSALLILAVANTGCTYIQKDSVNQTNNKVESNETKTFDEYYSARVQYVGNNSEVIDLLNRLGVGDLGEYTIALQTDKEPYRLTVQYSTLKNEGDQEKFKTLDKINYAYFALALIDNLSTIDINYGTFNYHLTIDDANKMVSGNIKDYGSSSEKLKELYVILNPKD